MKSILLANKEYKKMQMFNTKLMWEVIDLTLNLIDCKIAGVDYVPASNKVQLMEDRHLHLHFDAIYSNEIDADFFSVLPDLTLDCGGKVYKVPHGHASFCGNLNIACEKTQHLDISINKVEYGSIDYDNKYYWRYVYPIANEDWFLKIAASCYHDDQGTTYAYNYLPIVLDRNKIHLYINKRKDDRYMVIQSDDMVDGNEMFMKVQSILTALGLVVGRKYGNYRFCMVSKDRNFTNIEASYWGTLDKTKPCNYRIVNTKWIDVYEMLQYPYQQYAKEMMANSISDPNLYYDDAPMMLDAFNALVNLCNKDNDMYLAASMLLEGTILNIMYQMPFFHVVLETITSSLMKDEDLNTPPPMDNEAYKSKVLPALLSALNQVDDIAEEARNIYIKRLTNNLNIGANNDKLTILFNRYGYELSDSDRDAIKKRNSVFHGHLSKANKPLTDQEWQMFAISLRLHKLCSILLLKASGFSGRILNNEVILGVKEACERNEPPYIEI